MIKGNILDVYPDYQKNLMVVWLINKGKATRIEDFYEPSFYIHAHSKRLYDLALILNDLPQVKKLNFKKEKTVLGSKNEELVLEVTTRNLSFLSKLADMIDSWGNYHDYEFFNVDVRMPTRYLNDKGVFCNALVSWDGKKFSCEDSQWAIDYELPHFKLTNFDIKRNKDGKIASFNDSISSIIVRDYSIQEENETDTILSAVKYIKKVDPDIVYTLRGDSFLLPYLYHRANIHGIKHKVNLGREYTQQLNPTKQAKSYFSYGQIIYRPAFYTLKGRVHIDSYSSFMYGESGLNGLVDISRCSNIPLQLLSRLGPGTAISQMQVNKAMEKGYLIPWKKNKPENWKTAFDLLVSDRGGLILDPMVGLHEDIIELDYASLYPSIMLKYNISPETIFCECCGNSAVMVPQLNYNICVKKMGLVPEVLEPIIHRRFCLKARSKNSSFDKKLNQEKQMAWKWILLVCFGYTGYRNARYGRIECHESITAFSRDILLSAIEVVEKAGYQILHGIIDSLWVKSLKNCVKPSQLSRMISRKTGIRMDVEGHYKWIVFLPSKQTGVGALNRYYGLFENGELKIRGIELRQKNTPEFLKKIQVDILKVFSQANNAKEFLEKIPITIKVLQDYAKKIIKNDVEKSTLMFTTRVARDISEYKVNNLVKSALLQLRDNNIHIEPGQSVRYIVKNEHSSNYKKRVCVAETFEEDVEIDVDFYLRHIAKCGESILVPFGYTIEKLKAMLQRVKNREKLNVSVLPRIGTYQTSF
jgi:DNA polymerase elongation subunit (family B)